MPAINAYHKNKFYKALSFLLIVIILFHSAGCANYYLIEKIPQENIANIENIIDNNKSVIIHEHWSNSNFVLNNAKVDSMSISGVLVLSENEFDYIMYSWKSTYKSKDKDNIDVAHIFLNYSHSKLIPGAIKIQIKDISKIELVKKDKTKTTMSHVIGWAGLSLLAFTIVAVALNPPVGTLSFPTFSF